MLWLASTILLRVGLELQ
jgi:hypothetical protein